MDPNFDTATSTAPQPAGEAVPISVFDKNSLETWLANQEPRIRAWVDSSGFEAKAGAVCPIPGAAGNVERILCGRDAETPDIWRIAALPERLPPGDYALEAGADPAQAALGWMLGAYRFDRYKTAEKKARPVLGLPEGIDRERLTATVEAVFLARDLINTPAEDLKPSDLAAAAETVAERHGAEFRVTVGDDLLERNYPAIHAVGRAAADAPRLIDMAWGDADRPKVTLVGKGVCFDSGGLGIKPASGMKLMKKDMGGAATVLGLAGMIMALKLPVRLRLLIPAVENAIAGNAYRPMDVIRTRSGTTVEIGHTDAEGRVILCDALADAAGEEPDLLLDVATLTGAARVALGTELPALFCNDDALAGDILAQGEAADDPLWRLPLWPGYRKRIEGDAGDITNAPEGPFGGAITAALFLERFVDGAARWAHIDTMGWNMTARPGRPKGGEALALRALFAAIEARYG
ncbi:MAG: leucyl aminopeptidase family protein [Rhodospirillaceae bacterium]|nr:leucyl aminopeptidase family protein [Rhodospirillaceae bacterium]MYK16158.1 leucyl aminopeptidase family protein [Rhodospirillaceae bacterium]MYK59657.1 leucyl aminopeptidase family protein [Rhodospirillaceae bacterium]